MDRAKDPDWRSQHGAIIEAASIATEDAPAVPGVRMRRVQAPVERYLVRGWLSKRQAEAAVDLRSDWEFGIVGACDSSRYSWHGGGGGFAGLPDGQLDAATAYRRAVEAMGKSISTVVLPIVIGDSAGGEITVEMFAAARGDDRKQVMGMLKIGLDALADHYASCPDRRRAAKYA